MTIKRITSTDIESNRVILRPAVTYISSGSDITGSMPLIANPSPNIKVLSEITPDSGPFQSQNVNIADFLSTERNVIENTGGTTGLATYLNDVVVSASLPSKNSKDFQIKIENIPGIQYLDTSTNMPRSGSLNVLVNSILERESEVNSNMSYGFTNYNCLGFLSGGNESSKTALVYQDESDTTSFKSFCVSFFVKPPKVTTSTFNPATIFHIDNIITVSMTSGSIIDKNQNVHSFEIVSQLASSNETRVDAFVYNTDSISSNNSAHANFSKNIAYTSNNAISKDSWHNVVVKVFENDSGQIEQKIIIDKSEITGSVSSFSPTNPFNRSTINSNGHSNNEIVIGNKLGINRDYGNVFVSDYTDYEKYIAVGGAGGVGSLEFQSPFFGEVHEIIFATSNNRQFPVQNFLESSLATQDPRVLNPNYNIDFYLPVLFSAGRAQTVRTTIRKNSGTSALSHQLLRFAPHENFVLSNDLRFPEVNITSFLGAYVFNTALTTDRNINRVYPRCIGMESIDNITNSEGYRATILDVNAHIAATELSTFFTRNNLIRPADNASFVPVFENYKKILEKTSFPHDNINETHPGYETYFLSSSIGIEDVSHVSMKGYASGSVAVGAFNSGLADFNTYDGNSISNSTRTKFFDNNLNTDRTTALKLSLKEFSGFSHSNLVTVIDIPQMFYSKKIHPGTFEITDHDLTGSNGMLTYNIKDNGLGALYRNDSAAPDKRNRCGLIFYDIGIAILTHPAYCLVGKNHYTIKFRGEKDLNVLNVNSHIGKYEFNESVNPSYNSLGKAGSKSNDEEVVMITSIDYLDENLNVVMRSNLSQPVSKREFDEILFRSRIDF